MLSCGESQKEKTESASGNIVVEMSRRSISVIITLISIASIFLGSILFAFALSLWSGYSLYGKTDQHPEGYWWPDISASDTYAQWAMVLTGAAATVVSVIALYAVRHQLRLTGVQNQAEMVPFVVIEMVAPDRIEWREGAFYSDGKRLEEMWCRVSNLGKSPAIVTGIFRRWTRGSKPIAVAQDDRGWFKEISLIVGGGGSSGLVRTNAKQLERYKSGNYAYFHGYIDYRDLLGNEYRSGFLIGFADGRFHLAWPKNDPSKHHREHIYFRQTRKAEGSFRLPGIDT